MKLLLSIYFCLSCSFAALAQEHVFILVDVSASRGTDPIKTEAKDQVYNLLLGQYASKGWNPVSITDKRITELINSVSKQPLIGQNSWVCLVPFGSKDTYKHYSIGQNRNHPIDFQKLFNQNYPTKFTDSYTYIQIAEAFTASLAKTYNINEYYMFIITDGLGDQDDTNSKNTYDTFEENLLLEWNNASSSIVKNIGALTKSKYYINLRKVTNVKSSQIPTSPGIQPPPSIVDTTAQAAAIKITSPSKGKKNSEYELNSENLNINWACPNCPQGIKYTVMVSEYDGGKYREIKKDLLSNTASFKVPNGKFRITVSSSNYPTASSDTTFVIVSTGGYGWMLFILFLIILSVVVYKIWNDRRKKNSKKSSIEKSNEIFPTDNSVAPHSTNSNHY